MQTSPFTREVILQRQTTRLDDPNAVANAGAGFRAAGQVADVALDYKQKRDLAADKIDTNDAIISYQEELYKRNKAMQEENLNSPSDYADKFELVAHDLKEEYKKRFEGRESLSTAFDNTARELNLSAYKSNTSWQNRAEINHFDASIKRNKQSLVDTAYEMGASGEALDPMLFNNADATTLAGTELYSTEQLALLNDDMKREINTKYMEGKIAASPREALNELQGGKFTESLSLPKELENNSSAKKIVSRAEEMGVSPALAIGVFGAETNFGKNNTTSSAGAIGEMQTMPDTLKDPGFGVTPARNGSQAELRRVGVDYLAAMVREFDGDEEAALIAYNAGHVNAKKFLASGRNYASLPDRKQTEPYVKKAMGYAKSYGGEVGTLPQEQVTALRQKARKGVKAQEKLAESEAKRIIDVNYSHYNAAIETATNDPATVKNPQSKSQKIEAFLEQMEKDPLFTETAEGIQKANSLRVKAFKAVEDDRKEYESIQRGYAIANGAESINRQDPESVKAFDNYYNDKVKTYEKLEPVERVAADADVISNALAVPKGIKANIQNAARTTDEEAVLQAADLIDRVSISNPHLLGDLGSEKDIARIRMVNDKVNAGIPPLEAIKSVDAALDPRNAISKEIAAESIKELDIDYKDRVLSAFNQHPYFLGTGAEYLFGAGIETEGKLPKEGLHTATAAYRSAFESQYALTGNAEESGRYAEARVKGTFHATSINGDTIIMQHAPEIYHQYDPEDLRGQLEEVAIQLKKDAILPETYKDNDEFLQNVMLVSTARTARTAATGKPQYKVMVKGAYGQLFDLLGSDEYISFDDAAQHDARKIKKAKEEKQTARAELDKILVK